MVFKLRNDGTSLEDDILKATPVRPVFKIKSNGLYENQYIQI